MSSPTREELEARVQELERSLQRFKVMETAVGATQILIAVMNGQAPIRVSRRTAIPAPLMSITRDGVSVDQLGIKEIHYPELVKRSHRFNRGVVGIGNQVSQQLVRGVDIESQALARFEEERPRIISATVTRLLTRAIIAGALSGAAQAAYERNQGKKMDGWAVFFMNVALDKALSSLDVPDCRCWNFLPAEILVGLVAAPPGEHTVTLQMSGTGGMNLTAKTEVKAGQLSVVQFYVTY